MDYGYPQITDPGLLKQYITQGECHKKLTNPETISQITIQATGKISWRPPNLKYPKNDVYIDVVENVNCLMSTRGTVLKTDVIGQVLMKTVLSGMPECKFGINDKLLIRAGTTSNPR